jgi:formylglycine-generating enzyme required for sulfatase activity
MSGARRQHKLGSWLLVLGAMAALSMALPHPSPALAEGAKAKTGRKRAARGCPSNMVNVGGRYCIDRYEAYVAEMLPRGKLRRLSPFKPVDGGKKLKALNKRGRMPQAYISRVQAEQACQNAGKRLCSDDEWVTACKGKSPTVWPYGKKWKPGRCNDSGVSSFNMFFGGGGREAPESAYTFENLNDPRLNKPKGTCAPSGRFKSCRNSYKVYDMVGNLHEWTAAPGGTFRGGYFLDVHDNGTGCDYRTMAHSPKYHDYSTGFRCCKSQ